MHGYLCVCRLTPDSPWMPVGQLRNEVHEAVGSQKTRLVRYLESFSMPAGERKRLHRWAKAWRNIHSKSREEFFTDSTGRQYGLLMMAITPYDSNEGFVDPFS